MLRYVARQAQTRKWFVDDIAIFRCPPGYSMLGNRRSRCQHNGRWGTPLPSCLPVANEETNCMRPEDPVNGEVVSSPPDKFQFFEGDSIEYICKEGFENDGEQIATCESGAWTSEPACRRLAECNHRQPPENGAYAENQLEQTTWFERETAVFACKTGYRIAGSQTSACQSDGRWSTEVPECRKRETCPNRSPPVNGEYVRRQEDKTTWYSGELASFVCNPGFMLEGSSAICTSAGTWTNPVPVCRNEVFCPNRPAPSNGRTGGMRRNRWRARDIARYRCSKGYRLVGQARSTCLLTGEWSSEIPICEALRQLTCPRPSNPPNGRVRSSPVRKDIFRHNEFVNYQCYANFEVIGGPTVTCMDGKWSHVPLCKRLGQRDLPTCVRPNNPVNGRVRTRPAGKRIFDDREFVTYVCSSGYRVVGDPRATCTNGRWSHEPTCTPTSNRVRTTKRPRVTTTTASKRRSSAETERPVNCFPRPAPVNGAYVKRQQDKKVWRENDIASFECNPGYVLNGARRSSCSSFGVWSASVPICTKENVENELTCERPLNPRNGRILSIPSAQTVFDEEDVVIYICDEGFEIDTIPFATCRSGQWDRSPTCEGVASTRCINRPPPPNVQYITSQELRTTWNVGDLAAFQCEFDEFQMFGSSVSTCLSSGEWSSDVPTCERPPRDAADECSRPVNPLNGKVHSYPTSVYFFDIGDVVQVECDSGYELISDNDGVMTCLGNTWTAAPTCEEP